MSNIVNTQRMSQITYKNRCNKVLYAKASIIGRGTYSNRKMVSTTLYTDKECTNEYGKLNTFCQRILRDGCFRIWNLTGDSVEYAKIICVDNGVQKTTDSDKSFKYIYDYRKH